MTKDSKERREEDKLKERKKIKDTPPTKVIIRRLPPTITETEFVEQISPLPQNDYFCFVKAVRSSAPYAFSRAYLNFSKQEDILSFSEKWDGHVFLDTSGKEYVAVVEFAPYSKVPKKASSRKVDTRSGTIEEDDDYIQFVESLEVPVEPLPSAETFLEELEQKHIDRKATEMTTPLLDYLKNKRAERIKAREDAKEERKRKEQERQKRRDEERRKKREDERKKRIKEREEREKRREKEKEAETKDDSVKILKSDPVSKEEARPKSKSDVRDRTRKEDSRTSSPRVESKEETRKEKDYDRPKSSRFPDKEREKERIRSKDGGRDKGRNGEGGGTRGGRASEPIKDRYRDREKDYKSDSRPSSSKSREAVGFSKEVPRKYDDKRDRKSSTAPTREKANEVVNKDKKDEVKQKVRESPVVAPVQKPPEKDNTESISSKKPTDERGKGPRIRNKDRPAMQIYRPGQRSAVKSTPSPDNDTSSSKSVSPEKSKPKESPTEEKAKDLRQRGKPEERPRTGDSKVKADKGVDRAKDDRGERNRNNNKGSTSARFSNRREYKRDDDKKRHWEERPRDAYKGGRGRDDRGRDDRGRDDRGKDDKKKEAVKDTVNKAKTVETKEK